MLCAMSVPVPHRLRRRVRRTAQPGHRILVRGASVVPVANLQPLFTLDGRLRRGCAAAAAGPVARALPPPRRPAILEHANRPDPLPHPADFPAARLTHGRPDIGIRLDLLLHPLPQPLPLARGELIAQHVVAQLAHADVGLWDEVGVLCVQGGLVREAVEGERGEALCARLGLARAADGRARVGGRGDEADQGDKLP